jgi:hypothetical protein
MARDRDNEFYDYVAPARSDSAIDAAERARVSAMARANAAARPETLLERAESQIAKTQARISDLETTQAESDALNPSAMTKGKNETNSAFNARVKAAEALARKNAMAENPLLNKAVKPTNAPAGQYYAWIGGTNTGQWQLYNIPGGGTGGVGGVGGTLTTSTTTVTEISDATKDAFAVLADLFASYGLEELAGEISGYMTSGLTAGEALIKLKTNPNGAYAVRFAGNFARVKNGMNALSEASYIELENSYTNTLKSYGLGNMLGADSKSNWKTFSTYIANDISAVEFKDRIATVQDRVVNADPATKELFKKWYPSLTDKDLVAYFLNPTETIGKLKEKVTASEIGAAFTGQGLSTDMMSATDLARYGIDRAGALLGASQIAGVLSETTKLGNVYEEAGINYTQKTGEEEFLKSNEAAKRKRTGLASLERGSFSASSGNAPGAYSTGYLKKSSAAGQI